MTFAFAWQEQSVVKAAECRNARQAGAGWKRLPLLLCAVGALGARSGLLSDLPRCDGGLTGMLLLMTNDELAAFYRRYNASCNEHRFDDLGEFVAEDVVINGTDHGLNVYADNLRPIVQAFPDFRWALRHLMVDAPWIAAHLADTGTHRGPFLGHEATGRSVSAQEFAFYRVDGGRIVEVWGTAFHLELLAQVG